jgi:superfamily II DNA or RNA helicase
VKLHPVIGARAFVPYGLLSPEQRREARKQLTFKETSKTRVDAIIEEERLGLKTGATHQLIEEYREGIAGISMPRAWTVNAYVDLPWRDRTVSVPHGIKFPKSIEPRDDAQSLFFNRLESEALKPGHQDIMAIAGTGTGKTVAGINLAQKLGERTLIVVDQNKIASGWIKKNFDKFYGERWVEKYVGRVQQDVFEVEGKAFTIAMAQTLARRSYPSSFYRSFGLIEFDEIQVFGAPNFEKLLGQFSARVRVGFTAEERGGQFGKAVRSHLGKPKVTSTQETLQPTCYMIRNNIPAPFYCENEGSLLTGLSRQTKRNENLAKLIVNKGYARDRNILVLSNRTEQLVNLRNLCLGLGVPKDVMGLHMGSYVSGRYQVMYSYGDSLSSRTLTVVNSKAEAQSVMRDVKKGNLGPEFYPAALYKRLQAGDEINLNARLEQYSPTQSELDYITNSCQIIFATYEIFSKAIDVPRLDMGIECLPSSNVKQPLGRILRLHPDKPVPEWYAIDDILPNKFDPTDSSHAARWTTILNSFFTGKTETRLASLKKANAKVVRA